MEVYYTVMQASAAPLPLHPFPKFLPRSVVRDYLFPLAAFLFVFLVPLSWYVAGFLILGQAHFAISFLYQYRAGKVNRQYGILAVLFLLISIAYFATGGGYNLIFLVATFFFGVHFAFDEFFLHGEATTTATRISAWVFVLLFFAMIVYTMFPDARPFAFAVGLIFPAYVLVRVGSRRLPSAAERYLWLVGVIIFTLTFAFSVRAEILLAVISILHQTNWYVDYGRRIADTGDAAKLGKYWGEIALSLFVSSVLYLFYMFGGVSVLRFLYLPVYYYAFALAHFGLSVRKRSPRPARA